MILEDTLDAALRQRLRQLSPEKRALLAARVRRQAGTKRAVGLIAERSQEAVLRQRLRQLSPEKRALLAARVRQQAQHDQETC